MERPEGPGSSGGGRRPPGPTRREIAEGVAGELKAAGLESPSNEAKRLVAGALGLDGKTLATTLDQRVDPDEAIRIARAVSRRLAGEPLQHVEGTVDFRSLTLVSDPRALIPRPETEQLIDEIARTIDGPTVHRVLEIGVGSGAIALSLLAEGLAERVLAVDVSGEALAQARENARGAGDPDGLALRRCGPAIWPDLADESPFDMIVSNPPYVASGDIPALQVEVREHEPRTALDGGTDGLDVVRTILQGAPAALATGGWLFLEIGADQGAPVRELLEADPRLTACEIRRDVSGRDRFAVAQRHV